MTGSDPLTADYADGADKFSPITDADWARELRRARAERNDMADQIARAVARFKLLRLLRARVNRDF